MYLILIIIVLIIFLFYIFLIGQKNENEKRRKEITYDYYTDIKPKLKNGDIILFSCNRYGSFLEYLKYFLRTRFVGSEYGHAGLVVKKNDKLYLIESTDYNQVAYEEAIHLNDLKRGGIRIVDLDLVLSEYKKINYGFYAVKFISKEIPQETIETKIQNYKHLTFPNKFWLYVLGFIDEFISHSVSKKLLYALDSNQMMCTELLHNFLYHCKVLKNYPSKLMWPHLITSNKFKNLEIIEYSDAYKFTL